MGDEGLGVGAPAGALGVGIGRDIGRCGARRTLVHGRELVSKKSEMAFDRSPLADEGRESLVWGGETTHHDEVITHLSRRVDDVGHAQIDVGGQASVQLDLR